MHQNIVIGIFGPKEKTKNLQGSICFSRKGVFVCVQRSSAPDAGIYDCRETGI